MIRTIEITQKELSDLPDYTEFQPKDILIGARWKFKFETVKYGLEIFVGEKISDEKGILKLAKIKFL